MIEEASNHHEPNRCGNKLLPPASDGQAPSVTPKADDSSVKVWFATMKQIGFSGFSISWATVTQPFIDAAHGHGMKVYVWTINDDIEIAGAMLNDVDGIITDDPAATMKKIRTLGK